MRLEVIRTGRWPVIVALGFCLLISGGAAPQARAGFDLDSVEMEFSQEDGSAAKEAGSHPFSWTTTYTGETVLEGGEEIPAQTLKELRVRLPPGLVGAPAALPRCGRSTFLDGACPASSAVGSIVLRFYLGQPEEQEFPLYSLEPLPGAVAELGFLFEPLGAPGLLRISLEPDPPYSLRAVLAESPQALLLFGTTLTIEGTAGDDAFLTLPRSCVEPLTAVFEASDWDRPDEWTTATVEVSDPAEPLFPSPLVGCERLGFAPTFSLRATTSAAHSAGGLEVDLDVEDPGLTAADGIAEADLREATIELPQGMSVNPAFADGLGACTAPQYASASSSAGEGCPGSSKVGTAQVESPLLDHPLQGAVYVAQPDDPATAKRGAENPFDSLLALYAVLGDHSEGLVLQLPIGLTANQADGRITATVRDVPPLPFSHLSLRLRGGPRGLLATPQRCGGHPVKAVLTPSTGAAALQSQANLEFDSSCEAPSFDPVLSAGTANPRAGGPSPLVVEVDRSSGEPDLRSLAVTLPEGVAARFGGVPICAESLIDTGSCPPASRVGYVRIAAGEGTPAWIPAADRAPGSVFLAGPHEGARFSLVVALPAELGPFDLGETVLRAPIRIDPRSARAVVRLGPLPQIIEGIPIRYRALRMVLDRPGFIRNPTSCLEGAVRAEVRSQAGEIAQPADRFQVGDCAALRFGPAVSARLFGPTHRGAHPRLRAVLRSRPSEANLRRASIALPPTQLLDLRHLGGVCSPAALAADRCPRASAIGWVRAWTPLLDGPLHGPLHLLGGKRRLPRIAASLDGELQIRLGGRIDSVRGRVRTSFDDLPDVPFSRVVVTFAGGRRGLLVNSGGVCDKRWRISAALAGQNGKRSVSRPLLRRHCQSIRNR